MRPLTEGLAEILAREVGDKVREHARERVLDWIACAAAGANQPAGRALVRYGQRGPAGPCSVIGARPRDASSATLVNGGLGNILEMDDVHRTSIVHPGDVVVPAAIAAAERDGAVGADFLSALVRGYEAAIRVGSAVGTGHYRYWYNTATCGIFGAAAAVSSLHGLDPARFADALGLAGMQASGLWQARLEPGFAKQLATARAAQGGLVAADLAADGFPAPHQILEGELGFFAATAPDAEPDRVTIMPQAPWQILDTSFKPWPGCRHAHPVIELALGLRGQIEPRDIKKVEIATYRSAVDFCDDAEPSTPHRAMFSLQHCFAVAFSRGVPRLDDFETAARQDPAIVSLRDRTQVSEVSEFTEAFPERYGASVVVHASEGKQFAQRVITAKGDPENPMSEGERLDKASSLMKAAGLNDKEISVCIAAVDDLPAADSLSALGQSLLPLQDILGDGESHETRQAGGTVSLARS